jgi:hypothetical protein
MRPRNRACSMGACPGCGKTVVLIAFTKDAHPSHRNSARCREAVRITTDPSIVTGMLGLVEEAIAGAPPKLVDAVVASWEPGYRLDVYLAAATLHTAASDNAFRRKTIQAANRLVRAATEHVQRAVRDGLAPLQTKGCRCVGPEYNPDVPCPVHPKEARRV